jgi:hypothetical protein
MIRISGPVSWARPFEIARNSRIFANRPEQNYRQQIKVVDERLALAGLRLAAALNEVLGHVSPQEFRH